MAPRDGDENALLPRQNQPAVVAGQGPGDGSDGEDDDIVDDDINEDDIVGNDEADDDSEDDSEEDMDRDEAEDDEDPADHEERMLRLRAENAELVATKMEQDLMLKDIEWKTEDIKEATLAKQNELKELREARRLRMEEAASGGASANPDDSNPDPNPSGSS